jgi:hypothetical protein
MDARLVADDERTTARAETLAAIQRQLAEQAAELALLRGPPDAPVPAAPNDDVTTIPPVTPGPSGAAGSASSDGRRSHLSVHSTSRGGSSPSPSDTAVPAISRLNLDDDNASVISYSRTAPTSKNFQNFLRSAEKSLRFSGSDSSDVNEWLVSVEELADTHGAENDEVLRGIQSLLTNSAKRFYREHHLAVRSANEPWDWARAKSWFLRKFNPESRILRKVTEYHRCAQGRRSVNDYLDELLELRNYTSTGPGTDLEQRVRFLSGLRPDLQVEVRKHLAAFPGSNFDATIELTRNLADILPKDHARDSTALKAIDAAQVRCYNCNEMGHFSNECPSERTARSKAAQDKKKARDERRRDSQRVNAVTDATAKDSASKDAAAKGVSDTTTADKGASGSKSRGSPVRPPSKTCPVFASTRVCDVGSTATSRSAPVMEIAAAINGKSIRLGLDTLAGLSCVGKADLTAAERKLCEPTSERLHHAGGELLSSSGEIELPIEIAGSTIMVTFNVIDTGKHNLGFLLGMDVLERYEFVVDCARRKVTFCPLPVPQDDLLRYRRAKEKQLVLTGCKAVFTDADADADFEILSARVNCVRSVLCLNETTIPAYSKLMVRGIFTARDDDILKDGSSRDFVFFPPDEDTKAAEKHFGLGLWPGLSRALVSADTHGRLLELPVHIVNAGGTPRVLKANTLLGTVDANATVVGLDTYLLKDTYVQWLESEFDFIKSQFTESFSIDADFEASSWHRRRLWINPPWSLSNAAVEKLVDEPPAEFVVLGVDSSQPWARTLRDMGCSERIVPKKGSGFFTQLQSDGTFRELPFPTWDLVAFHGTRDLVLAYKTAAKSKATPPTSTGVRATTSTTASSPTSDEYLNVVYAPTLTPEQLAEATALVHEYADVFDDAAIAGRIVGVECDIDTGDHAPLSCQPFQTSPAKRAKIDAKIDRMLQLDIIEPSTSPWASRFFLVPQPGREDREVVDYRPLNGVTKKDVYPLPRIDDTLMLLHGLRFVSTFDGSKGFWQIKNTERAKLRSAFICHRGLYQFRVMSFGLTNAPGIFQRMMDTTFAGLKWVLCLVYLDDVIVWAFCWTEHLSRCRKVLERCRERNLCLKAKKSFFGFTELTCLGHTVNASGRKPDAQKTIAISALADPKNVSELATFLGMTGFYSEYIPDYATIAYPLNELRKKGVEWLFTDEHRAAVASLKAALVSDAVLVHPDYSKQFIVMPDASIFAVGGVLAQLDDQGRERPLSYRSKKLNSAEQNYAVYELEALGVIYCVRKFRHYIEGTTFLLITDHNALLWLFRQPNLRGKLARWALDLQQFDFTIIHRAGHTSSPTPYPAFVASTSRSSTTSRTCPPTTSATRPSTWATLPLSPCVRP